MNTQRIGIHAIGAYLPEEVRGNDWWPAATVQKWRERAHWAETNRQTKGAPSDLTPGMLLAMDAMSKLGNDPFKGAVQRRMAPATMRASEMELRAAKDALSRAKMSPDEIDLVLVHSTTPDYLNVPNACKLHHSLGLREDCLAMSIEGMCNAFQLQLTMAERMLQGKRGYALLVQSCNLPRFAVQEEQSSVWVGEGATAVLVGPVANDLGVLATSHFSNGSKFAGLVVGVEGKNWYDEGRTTYYSDDRAAGARILAEVPDQAKQSITSVLEKIRTPPEDVAFYAAHQGAIWLREVTQKFAGLTNAKSVDTFAQFTSLSAANLPLVLAIADRERMLKCGDLTVLFSGGTGQTWSATALRWGTD